MSSIFNWSGYTLKEKSYTMFLRVNAVLQVFLIGYMRRFGFKYSVRHCALHSGTLCNF